MNILVTGGSGFIGSHLIDRLEKEDHKVKVLDVVKPHKQGIKLVNANILDYKALEKATKGVDVVYHLAAYPDIGQAFAKPVEFMNVNTYGTLNVLEAARKNDVKRVIFSSSVWVYSTAEEDFVTETTQLNPSEANHPFTLGKLISEAYLQNYKRFYNQEFTILRYGVTYGSRAKPNGLVPCFIKKLINNEEVTVFGNGNQTRSLIHVKDIVEGNVAVLKDIAKNKTYNLDGSKPISINEFLKVIQELFDKKVKIKYEETKEGDYKGKIVSIERARKELNWMPKVSLKEGIKEYAGYI